MTVITIISRQIIFLLFITTINCQLFWEQLFDTLSYKNYHKPPPRRDSAIAYDRDRNRIILFGGCQTRYLNDHYPVVFDDTWEYSIERKMWRELTLSISRPSARYGMTYSHNKYGMFIAGGRVSFGEFYNDIWVFDFNTDIWKRMDQNGFRIPANRSNAVGGMFPGYETNDLKMANFYMLHGQSLDDMYGNLYRYSLTDVRTLNGVWNEAFHDEIGPYGADYPHARYGASASLIHHDTLLMFGGCLSSKYTGGPCPSSDSWIFVRNKWERVDSSCISPRIYSSMASLVSDGAKVSAVLFGGLEKDRTIFKTDEEYENEVSIYDHVYKRWIRKRVQGFYFPEKRSGHVMCTGKYNSDYGVYVFGGYGQTSETNLADLWFLKANITAAFNAPNINECSNYFSSIHLHSILMFVGWALCINFGILLARYTTKKVWIKVHRFCQITGLLLISAGIFFGYWSARGRPHLAHALIGSAAYLLALSQPMSAYLRYRSQNIDYYVDEDEKFKAENSFQKKFEKIWVSTHQYSGHFANALALVNISLGVFYAVYHWMWYIIWFTYLGFIISIYIMLELKLRYFSKNKKNKRSTNEDADYAETMNNLSLKETRSTPIKKQKAITDDSTDFSDDGAKFSTRSVAANRYIKQSPITPPPPYYNRSEENSLKTNNSSPSKPSTLPKQSKLLEYSQSIANASSMKKNSKQSYSKQFLVDHTNTDDEHNFEDEHHLNRSNSRIVNNRVLQYSPKFKTSYENNTKY